MDVEDRLAGGGVAVEYRPISAIGMAEFGCDLGGRAHHFSYERIVCRHEVVERADVPARHDQHVRGGLRGDVLEGHDAVVLKDDRGGDLTRDDLAEKTVRHPTS